MKLKVGITNYINALPFYAAFQKKIVPIDAEFVFDIPSKLNLWLNEKKLDCALISSYEYLHNDHLFLSPFGIGACGPIYSVNLYIKEHCLSVPSLSCAVTEHSATSKHLLKVLAKHFWKQTFHLTPLDRKKPWENNDSFLLIGNEALENQHIPGFTTIDLAQVWHEKTKLGFVFALFAMHKECAHHMKSFCQALATSIQWAQNNFRTIFDMAMSHTKHDIPFLQKYYQAHRYILSENEFQGLTHFSHFLHYV